MTWPRLRLESVWQAAAQHPRRWQRRAAPKGDRLTRDHHLIVRLAQAADAEAIAAIHQPVVRSSPASSEVGEVTDRVSAILASPTAAA